MNLCTPDVLLPRLDVTRLIASAFAENDLVRIRVRDFTFPYLPTCCAFTIRACNRATALLVWFQFIRFHSSSPPTRTSGGLPTFLFSLFDISVLLHSRYCDLRPVRSLHAFALRHSRYPLHYKAAFAFSNISYPHSYQCSSRNTFPCGRNMDLPSFA